MSTPSNNWLVPFAGRNHSGATQQNFLWNSGNIYVMDNHRAALWCWLRAMDLTKPHSIIHIDRHTDALSSRMAEWLENLPNLEGSIEEYLDKSYNSGCGAIPVIRWDNYLSIYLRKFGRNARRIRFLTHNEGDIPAIPGIMRDNIWDLPENFSYWLSDGDDPWIINIDLDYFYCNAGDTSIAMVSQEFLEAFFSEISKAVGSGRVGVITV